MVGFVDLLSSKEFSFLTEVTRILGSSLNLQESVRLIFNILHHSFNIKKSILTKYSEIKKELFIKVLYGLNPSDLESKAFEEWQLTMEKVLESNKPIIVPNINYERDFFDHYMSDDDTKCSFVCIPLILGNQKFGVLSVFVPYFDDESLENVIRLLGVFSLMIAQELKLKKLLESEKDHLRKENVMLKNELADKYQIDNMIGKSNAMHNVFESITQVASNNVTVIIRGDSGTGKELVAHAIHYKSNRSRGPFIKINCGAIPETLIESELFGHKKGAFTDAIETKIGKFEAANGGTIFLDEVAELSPALQVKLLRVLQEKEITRIGDIDPIQVDVRVITATNKDLENLMETGDIREDFYYRLNVFPIMIPSLRQRRTDIMLLAEHFLEKFSVEHTKNITRIASSVIDLFYSYNWPGNVRELENCIERAVILCNDDALQPVHLPPSLQRIDMSLFNSEKCDLNSLKDKVNEFEKKLILDVLHKTQGNISMAAKELQTTQRILGYKIEKLEINILDTKKKIST